eukprot:4875550-Amphidinium_carterae.1
MTTLFWTALHSVAVKSYKGPPEGLAEVLELFKHATDVIGKAPEETEEVCASLRVAQSQNNWQKRKEKLSAVVTALTGATNLQPDSESGSAVLSNLHDCVEEIQTYSAVQLTDVKDLLQTVLEQSVKRVLELGSCVSETEEKSKAYADAAAKLYAMASKIDHLVLVVNPDGGESARTRLSKLGPFLQIVQTWSEVEGEDSWVNNLGILTEMESCSQRLKTTLDKEHTKSIETFMSSFSDYLVRSQIATHEAQAKQTETTIADLLKHLGGDVTKVWYKGKGH